MLIRTVIVDEIHDNADITLLRFGNQFFHIRKRAKGRVDARVVADIIAVVNHGRWIDRRQPERTCAELLQIIELFRDAAQITCAAACGIVKALWIYLVDSSVLPPFRFFHPYSFRTLMLWKCARYQNVSTAVLPATASMPVVFFISGYSLEFVTAMITVS